MDSENIQKVMKELGVSTLGQWMKLPDLLTDIQFANDMREFVSNEDFYKFDMDNSCLYVSRNHKGEFVEPDGNYTINTYYNFAYIDAFVCSSIMGPYGSSFTRSF